VDYDLDDGKGDELVRACRVLTRDQPRRRPPDARGAQRRQGPQGIDIAVYSETGLCETHKLAELPGGPLGSVPWLTAALAQAGEPLQVGDLVLTGSPESLIPVVAGQLVRVEAGGMMVESRFY
jgi:hypothetical protein